MGNTCSDNEPVERDFSFIEDQLSRRALYNLSRAITETKKWDWLKTFEPDRNKGFVFSQDSNLKIIENALDQSDPANGHSGSSWGWAMRNMSHIASFGYDDFEARWKKQKAARARIRFPLPPAAAALEAANAVIAAVKAADAAAEAAEAAEKAVKKAETNAEQAKHFCNAMEASGLVNSNLMDNLNRNAYNVMKNQGTEAAVNHMFTDQETGRRLSYGEMRSRYG